MAVFVCKQKNLQQFSNTIFISLIDRPIVTQTGLPWWQTGLLTQTGLSWWQTGLLKQTGLSWENKAPQHQFQVSIIISI